MKQTQRLTVHQLAKMVVGSMLKLIKAKSYDIRSMSNCPNV